MRKHEKLPLRMRIRLEVTNAHGRSFGHDSSVNKARTEVLDIWIQKRALAIMIENKTQFYYYCIYHKYVLCHKLLK